MRQVWQRKMSFWQWGCRIFQVTCLTFWLQVVLLVCSVAVEAAVVSSSDVSPSMMATHSLAPSSPLPELASTVQQLPDAIQTPSVNSTTLTSTSSHLTSTPRMSIQPMQTLPDTMMMVMVSTQVDTSIFHATASLPSFNSVITMAIPGQTVSISTMPSVEPTQTSHLPKSVLSASKSILSASKSILNATLTLSDSKGVFSTSSSYIHLEQTSTRLPELLSSISPTPSASSVFPVLNSSEHNSLQSSIPLFSSQGGVKSTTLPDKTLVTLSPTPSPTVTASSTSISSIPLSSSVIPLVPSTPVLSSQRLSLSSALSTNTLPIMPSPTPAYSQTTRVQSLSSLPKLSSVSLMPTPTAGPTSHPPTTEKSTGGALTMAQWIGVAVAATAAFIIMCVIIWWLLREQKSGTKHKPTYTKDNVTIDYSRSTSTDPKDVWRNSLLLESMSTRIVVPEEDDDDEMQAVANHGFEGISDEEEQPTSSQKDIPLTKV